MHDGSVTAGNAGRSMFLPGYAPATTLLPTPTRTRHLIQSVVLSRPSRPPTPPPRLPRT